MEQLIPFFTGVDHGQEVGAVGVGKYKVPYLSKEEDNPIAQKQNQS